jgi:RHS repeat-associated protein
MDLTSGTTSAPFALAYNADGQPTTLGPFTLTRTGPGGLPTRIGDGSGQFDLTFDSVGRLATRAAMAGGTPVYREDITHDNGGRIIRRIETVGGTTTTYDYEYDADNQLLRVLRGGLVAEQYTYDARGNRSSRQLGAGPAELATYDLQDRIQSRGATNYTFGVDGFMVGRGGDTFQYGARGELMSAVVGGQAATYGYDGFGRRTSRTDATGTAQYLYGNPENDLQLTAARDPAGVLSTYIYDDGGRLIGIQRGTTRYYVATNILGSPVAVADATGAIVKRLEWDAFGTLVADSNPGFDLPLGFAGGLRDPLSGLTRFGVRDYDPLQGRWVSRDAAFFQGRQTNMYVYADNDPVNKADLGGLVSGGMSAYDGLGGGFKFAITDKGLSVCFEMGVGFGDSIELNPFGDLDDNGVSLDASAAFKWGPAAQVELSVKHPLKECASDEWKGKGCVGGICAEETLKDGNFKGDAKFDTDPSRLGHGFKALFTNLGKKMEIKSVANFCAQGKF